MCSIVRILNESYHVHGVGLIFFATVFLLNDRIIKLATFFHRRATGRIAGF